MLDVRFDLGGVLLELRLTQSILLHDDPLPLYVQCFVDEQAHRQRIGSRRHVNGIAGVGLADGMGKRGAAIGRVGTVVAGVTSISGYIARDGSRNRRHGDRYCRYVIRLIALRHRSPGITLHEKIVCSACRARWNGYPRAPTVTASTTWQIIRVIVARP